MRQDNTMICKAEALATPLAIAILAIIAILIVPAASAANNPGHDSLYLLKLGDNMTGPLNISSTLTAYSLQTATLMYGSQLDIQANGTLIAPARPTIQSAGNNLYLDSASGDIRIATQAGTSNYIRIGTGNINVIVNGTLRQYDQLVCLANGSNCPSSMSGANITGTGSSGYLSRWTSGTNLGNSVIYDDGTNVGIGTGSPTEKLSIAGNMSTTGNITMAGSIVCTASNGLCGGGSGGGWSNDSATTSTSLNVNITTGSLTVPNGNIGIGTSNPSQRLDVNGIAKASSLMATSNLTFINPSSANSTREYWYDSNGAKVAERYWNGSDLILNITR